MGAIGELIKMMAGSQLQMAKSLVCINLIRIRRLECVLYGRVGEVGDSKVYPTVSSNRGSCAKMCTSKLR